jgi:hypothetical protein
MATADIVFTVTTPLRDEVVRLVPGARVHVIGHFVEEAWFEGLDLSARPGPVRNIAYASPSISTGPTTSTGRPPGCVPRSRFPT